MSCQQQEAENYGNESEYIHDPEHFFESLLKYLVITKIFATPQGYLHMKFNIKVILLGGLAVGKLSQE